MKCAICGKEIPLDNAQLIVYNKSAMKMTSACMQHEFTYDFEEVNAIYQSKYRESCYEKDRYRKIKSQFKYKDIVYSKVYFPSREKIIDRLSKIFSLVITAKSLDDIVSSLNLLSETIKNCQKVLIVIDSTAEVWKNDIRHNLGISDKIKTLVFTSY